MPNAPADDRCRLTVVKFGGSHALRPHFRPWVDALAACGGNVVVVPGGGPFADTVRQAQRPMGFGDEAAHRMALLAMEQYAVAIASLHDNFALAASEPAIRAAIALDKATVWMPSELVLADPMLPTSWDLTSDSLSAWLAHKLAADRLILVKHVGDESESLAWGNGVDPLFDTYCTPSTRTVIAAQDDWSALGRLVGRQAKGGARGAPPD